MGHLIKEDKNDYGQLRENLISDIDQTYTVDTMIVKGVSANREENDCNYDYNLLKHFESQGMRLYMHKYFLGYMHYYLHLKFEQHLRRLMEIKAELESKRKELAAAEGAE